MALRPEDLEERSVPDGDETFRSLESVNEQRSHQYHAVSGVLRVKLIAFTLITIVLTMMYFAGRFAGQLANRWIVATALAVGNVVGGHGCDWLFAYAGGASAAVAHHTYALSISGVTFLVLSPLGMPTMHFVALGGAVAALAWLLLCTPFCSNKRAAIMMTVVLSLLIALVTIVLTIYILARSALNHNGLGWLAGLVMVKLHTAFRTIARLLLELTWNNAQPMPLDVAFTFAALCVLVSEVVRAITLAGEQFHGFMLGVTTGVVLDVGTQTWMPGRILNFVLGRPAPLLSIPDEVFLVTRWRSQWGLLWVIPTGSYFICAALSCSAWLCPGIAASKQRWFRIGLMVILHVVTDSIVVYLQKRRGESLLAAYRRCQNIGGHYDSAHGFRGDGMDRGPSHSLGGPGWFSNAAFGTPHEIMGNVVVAYGAVNYATIAYDGTFGACEGKFGRRMCELYNCTCESFQPY